MSHQDPPKLLSIYVNYPMATPSSFGFNCPPPMTLHWTRSCSQSSSLRSHYSHFVPYRSEVQVMC